MSPKLAWQVSTADKQHSISTGPPFLLSHTTNVRGQLSDCLTAEAGCPDSLLLILTAVYWFTDHRRASGRQAVAHELRRLKQSGHWHCRLKMTD